MPTSFFTRLIHELLHWIEGHLTNSQLTGISYGDRLWFKDTDATTSEEDDKEDYLGNIQIDS